MRRRIAVTLALAAALLAFAAAAHACAVCGAEGAARNRAAFFGTTILLSLLPLAMLGGGLWWLAKRLPGGLAGEFEVTDSSAGATGAGGASEPAPAVAIAGPPRAS